MTEQEISKIVFDCALRVHKALGPGLLESAYEECLYYELKKSNLKVEKQKPLPLVYEEVKLDVGYTIGIASILILAYLFVNNRESIDLKKLLFSLTSVLAFFGMLYLGLCFLKDVDPLSRLIEF